MRKATLWLTVVVAMTVVFGSATMAFAAPDPANSSVEWSGLLCDGNGDIVIACPAGDGSSMTVTVHDEFNQPYVGGLIQVDFASVCSMCLCPPIEVTTNEFGRAEVDVYAGLARVISTDCCVVTTEVQCDGVTIPWSGGGNSDVREWISPDLNADCVVDASDDAIFQNRMGGTACACDYNCDGFVNVADVAFYSLHGLHTCPVTPIENSSWGVIKALFTP